MPQKIIHITPVFYPYMSGMSRACWMYASYLAKRGFGVSILTPSYDGKEKIENIQAVRVEYLRPYIKWGNGAFTPRILSRLKELCGEGCLVHLHLPFFGFQEIFALFLLARGKKRLKCRIVVQFHHDPELSGLRKAIEKISYFFVKYLFKKADWILVSSIDYARESRWLGKFVEKDKAKIVEIPFAVDIDAYQKERKIDKSKEEIRFLFVGALDKAHNFKGIDVLIYALDNLFRKRAELRERLKVYVVGKGDLLEYYKNLSQKMELADNIEFLGFVSDDFLKELYTMCDAFVFPSVNRAEAFGIAVLEAMAGGLPVICSRLPGVVSLVEEENLLFTPGDYVDLSQKIEIFVSNKNYYYSIGLNNRQKVVNRYNINLIIDKIIEKYYM